ncbi:hypothetical protein EHO59_09275 [Leptospira semungkisensis]|uniref:Uncharacterized protein n=1 Tax=Leptospira semungkisensis TaxID=2484985 RepID=A0A4R9G1D9_9LEPT|nr:hypothetical protein [Leptospira semungkisensis]TGK05023.1 hypothetical protein EHO59_09275 [Leptospira semungkisensis]
MKPKGSFHFYRSVFVLFVFLTFFFTSLISQEDPHDRPKKLEVLIPESAKEGPWSDNPLEFKDLDLLGDFSEDNSKQSLQQTEEYLSRAMDGFKLVSDNVKHKREKEESKNPESERFEWQRKTRLENAERVFAREITKARLESIRQLALAIKNLDKIANPRIRKSESFLELRAGVYREFIKHQYALQNFNQSAEFLEKYISLDPKFNDEAEPHRILTHCYERLYLGAKKSKSPEGMEYYQARKKKHGILYAEKAYGRNSYEFKKVLELLAKE